MKRAGLVILILFVAVLVGWSLVNQYRRPAILGERVVSKLTQIHGQIRHAAVLVDFVPPTEARPESVTFEKKILWRNGEGYVREKSHKDAVLLKSGDAEIYRYVDDEPLVHRWLSAADVTPLRKALVECGYWDDFVKGLIREAREKWLAGSDGQLLLAMLVADEGALMRCETPESAVQLGVALLALEVSGPVGVITTQERTVYVFQESDATDFKDIAECRWVAIGHDGREECYGVIKVPRAQQAQTMMLMWAAMRAEK